MSRKEKIREKKMSEKKIDENVDKLLEAEMIKEARMIEENFTEKNNINDISISDEDVEKSYQQFLKRLEAEGMLDEDTDNKTAEIVKFPGGRMEEEWEETAQELLKENPDDSSEENMRDIIAHISETIPSFDRESRKGWYRYGATAGIAMLAALGILAGSMAGQADSAKFASTVQHIINSDIDMP